VVVIFSAQIKDFLFYRGNRTSLYSNPSDAP
jgi:hypothetical protein